jgi:serine/threonine-protein kinase
MVTLTVPRAVVATVVRVPRLVGLDLARARAGLSAAGLTLGNVTYHDGAPEGLVYRQVPTAGTRVRTTTRVDVVLGRRARPTLVTVPNIIGRIVEDAREIILRAGLVPGTVTRRTTTDPRIRNGQVISQNPTAGRYVAKGTALQIVVAQKSVPTIRVPVLTNLALAAARARLTAMGLLVGRVTYKVSTRPGVVLTQNPSANSRVYRGTKVDFVVGKQASTPPPTQDIVRVPSVVLRGEADARKILERAGLKVGRILRVPGLPRKRVAVQIPLPGVRVKKGSKVTLHITR